MGQYYFGIWYDGKECADFKWNSLLNINAAKEEKVAISFLYNSRGKDSFSFKRGMGNTLAELKWKKCFSITLKDYQTLKICR